MSKNDYYFLSANDSANLTIILKQKNKLTLFNKSFFYTINLFFIFFYYLFVKFFILIKK